MIHARSRRGLTLLEVLIAMIILAFGLLGLAPLMVTAMRGNDRGREMSEATVHCSDVLETMKDRPMVYLETLIGAPLVDTISAQGAGGVKTYVMTTSTDTATATNGVAPGMLRIRVAADWMDEDGRAHSVTVSTYRSTSE